MNEGKALLIRLLQSRPMMRVTENKRTTATEKSREAKTIVDPLKLAVCFFKTFNISSKKKLENVLILSCYFISRVFFAFKNILMVFIFVFYIIQQVSNIQIKKSFSE